MTEIDEPPFNEFCEVPVEFVHQRAMSEAPLIVDLESRNPNGLELVLEAWIKNMCGAATEKEFGLELATAEVLALTLDTRGDAHTERARIALGLCRRLAVRFAHDSYHLSRRELREPFKVIAFLTRK
jgi:hypothetical protein